MENVKRYKKLQENSCQRFQCHNLENLTYFKELLERPIDSKPTLENG